MDAKLIMKHQLAMLTFCLHIPQMDMATQTSLFETHTRVLSRYCKEINILLFSYATQCIGKQLMYMIYLLPGDKNLAETVANVLTSLPFVALGIQAPRLYFSVHNLKCMKKPCIFVTSCLFAFIGNAGRT